MKTSQRPRLLILLLIVSSGLGFTWWRAATTKTAGGADRKIAYYQDSMHPWIKSAQPGKCTICGMDLTPIHEGDQGFGAASDVVVLNSNQITVLNVQTEEITRQPLRRTLRVAGTLEANETRKTVVAAPAVGRVERLMVDYAGVEVEEGQPLLNFYSPVWANLKRQGVLQSRPVSRAMERVLDPSDTAAYVTALTAPQAGTVVERNVYLGQYVQEGDKMFTIIDSSILWFRFDVYEQQLPWFELGQKLAVTVPTVPGRVFPATITFVEPTINEASRTVKIRADVANPLVPSGNQRRRLLQYGLYAEARVQAELPGSAVVPRNALLMPGGQAYAYVEKSPGAYERRRVKLGRQGDDFWEVLQGLKVGERVVTSGNVLIDSQAQFAQSSGFDKADSMAASDPAETSVLPEQAMPVMASSQPTLMETGPAAAPAPTSEKANPPAGAHAMADHAMPMTESAVKPAASPAPTNENMSLLADAHAMADHAMPMAAPVVKPSAKEDSASARMVIPRDMAISHDPSPRSTVTADVRAKAASAMVKSAELALAAPMKTGAAMQPMTAQATAAPADAAPSAPQQAADAMAPAIGSAAQPTEYGSLPGPRAARMTFQQRRALRSAAMEEYAQMRATALAGLPDAPTVFNGKVYQAAESQAKTPDKKPEMPSAAREQAAPAAESQPKAIAQFLTAADGISQALAGDSLEAFNQQTAGLFKALPGLQQSLPASHRCKPALDRIAALGQGQSSKDLAEARKRFLPLSTNLVEFARQLPKDKPEYETLKVYHCPMAPPPGLWIQLKGPLRNPYYGAKMLTCGEEAAL